MNIYLKKYIKYKKKYYKIKYGGKIENNSIEIFRCYLDILLYKLDIKEKNWSNIRESKKYNEVKQKYEETTKDSTKNNGFFQKMYMNTPFLKDVFTSTKEAQARVTVIYDKYIRVGNENVCMPHGIKLFEVCKENKEFYKWYDPNDPDNKTPSQVEIGKNIGTKKISSYLKIQSQYENFNSLSKIKYIIERCLFNPDYTDKDKIKAIIVPLSVNALYEEKEIQSECTRYTNHANMFLIKINRPKDNDKTTADYVKKAADNVKKAADNFKKAADDVKKAADDDKKAADDIKKAADNVKKTADDIKKAAHDVKKAADDVKKAEAKIKLELQYFDPNGKQSLYLKKRFEKYAEEINKVSEDKYVITGVKELDFDINNSAIKGQKSAIHKIFPNKWIDGGICGSITWIIFILWVKVCSVVKDFDDFYNDIINILFIQSWQDWIIFENSQLDQYEKNHYLNLIDSKINV